MTVLVFGSNCNFPMSMVIGRKQPIRRYGRRTCPYHFFGAVLLAIVAFCPFVHSADIVLVSSGKALTPEQRQLEIAAQFYGLNLTVIDAGSADVGPALKAAAVQTQTVAVVIEADALRFVHQDRLLESLKRGPRGSLPLLVAGVTADTDSNLLERWSKGMLVGANRLAGSVPLRYEFGSQTVVTRQLAGVELPFPGNETFYLALSGGSKAQLVMSVAQGGHNVPVLIEEDLGEQKMFVLARTLPQSDSTMRWTADSIVGAFVKVAPMMIFAKYCAGDQGWHAVHHYANLTIDDPWLRQPYGHLDYKNLLEEMQKHNFHTTIAFIPWNYDRNKPDVVSLFRSHPERYSICIHGNNHDHEEFIESRVEKIFDVQQSLVRMDQFEKLTGIPYDKVMIFPHNIGSEDILDDLKAYNFLATINSSNVPLGSSNSQDLLSALRPVTLAYANFPSINRYSAEMHAPEPFIAVNGFLDNPLFFYSHHGMFAAGSGAFNMTADAVNKLQPDTRWRNVGDIVRHMTLFRLRADANYDVTTFSNAFELENTYGRDVDFYVTTQESGHHQIASVSADGRALPFTLNEGSLKLRVPVANGGLSHIQILYNNDLELASVGTSQKSLRVYLLRMASDFRDIALPRFSFGKAFTRSYYEHEAFGFFTICCGAILLLFCTCVIVWLIFIKRRKTSQQLCYENLPWSARMFPGSDHGHLPSAPKMTRYVIITPVRDEERFIEATISSLQQQTIRPVEWVIVDDGSTDRTAEILDRHAAQNSWIRVVHRPNRGFRKAGGGVMEAFYAGYNVLRGNDWDFIVKLDGDLSLAANYFQKCFEHFEQDPHLGIGGGDIYHDLGGDHKLETNPKFHVRGATKIYKRACWEAIGGLVQAPGWDTIDEVKANMLGWKTYSFEELRIVHHRFTGTAEGLLHDRIKRGVACYVSGYHPLFLIASCISRLVQKPYVTGAAATAYGFVKGYYTSMPRVNDTEFIKYLRRQQLRRLCGLETIWK
ncbi:MAG TPA: glycosyltransferase family A protein [Terriglobales bacterium]|nr:glycosyltransferase family A protein [Terriglobales bacterium]